MGAVAIGVVLAVLMATGWWTPPGVVALVAFLGVMAGFPTLGVSRAMLEDPEAMTAAGVFDRELITTAFVAIIENADTAEGSGVCAGRSPATSPGRWTKHEWREGARTHGPGRACGLRGAGGPGVPGPARQDIHGRVWPN